MPAPLGTAADGLAQDDEGHDEVDHADMGEQSGPRLVVLEEEPTALAHDEVGVAHEALPVGARPAVRYRIRARRRRADASSGGTNASSGGASATRSAWFEAWSTAAPGQTERTS